MRIFARSRARHVVRDLYRAILGREPDSEGARAYEDLILRIGADRAIPKLLKAFLQSKEFLIRADALANSHVNAKLAAHGDQLINGLPVAHLASLGSFCLPSLICRDNGLRRYSLPFDWIFSTPRMVRDCLEDDFAAFLDRRYYRSISDQRSEPGAEHELYREKYDLRTLFAHHDPTREVDYLHFARCVARFRQLMRSDETKLFIAVSRPQHDLPTEFPLMIEALARVTPNFALLGVELLDPIEPGLCKIELLNRTNDHSLYRFTPSAFDSVRALLPDKIDEWALLRLVYRYKLALKEEAWSDADSSEPTTV